MLSRYIFRIIAFIVLSGPLFSALADPIDNVYLDGIVKNYVNRLMEVNHIPGVAVELILHGQPHAYYFGYANLETRQPVSGQTIFEIGSVSKLFTTLLLAENVKSGTVDLNQPIGKYIPDFVQYVPALQNVSLLQLATHTSGLPFDVPTSIKSRESLARYLRWWRFPKKLGGSWIYSNVGIGVLGDCLEAINFTNYNELYRNRILQPLGMEPIGISIPETLYNNYAQGYRADGTPANRVNLPAREAAGSIKASADDMMKFLKASIGFADTPSFILSAMRLTQTPFIRLPNSMQGLGWVIYPLNQKSINTLLRPPGIMHVGPIPAKQLMFFDRHFNGDYFIDKTGTTAGFRAYIEVIPNQQSGLVILVNRRISDSMLLNTARNILLRSINT